MQECTRWRKRQISGSRNVRREEKLTNLNLESSRLDVPPPFFQCFDISLLSSPPRQVEESQTISASFSDGSCSYMFQWLCELAMQVRANVPELILQRSAVVLDFSRRPLTDLMESTRYSSIALARW